MTPEQAIYIIGNLDCDNYNICDSQEAKAMAIAALEKQITKKPNKKMMLCEGTYIGHCPTCSKRINSELLYCWVCGQKIDWEE